MAGDISRAYLAEKNLPGLSVAVGVGGAVVWAEGFGWADIEEKVPVAPDTRFRIGSASVALTSAAVGLLVEQGKLKLDEGIQSSVPGYPKKEWPVTLRQVMAHVGGIPSDGGDESPMFNEHCARAADGLKFFSDEALRFEPGTHYSFSNYGWVLVSAAIEAAAGEPFDRFMRQHVIEPLDLTDTRIETGAETVAGMALSYFPAFRADPTYGLDAFRALRLSCYAGASAVVSTPSDLVRFAMAINSGKLLQPATVQMFQTSQRLRSGEETGYGLGWDLETATLSGKPTALVGHDGDILAGQAASFMTFPEYGITVAVISNTSYAGTFDLAVKIAQAFVNKK
jgi:CubicO group peptidase (beta-lactamase class C family)